MLEEGSFRGKTADFIMMFVFGGFLMTIIACFVNLVFLGQAFTIMLVKRAVSILIFYVIIASLD